MLKGPSIFQIKAMLCDSNELIMFTGIIREIGTIQHLRSQVGRMQYQVRAPESASRAILGASIAIDGICQTVVHNNSGILTFDAIDETLSKTSLKYLKNGQQVHVEPAMKLGDAIDGHLVYGHVDCLAKVNEVHSDSKRFDLTVKIPPEFNKYCIQGGSIAIQGASLTIYKVHSDLISVSLIPETLVRTLFSNLKAGDLVNIEVDSIGKWIEKLMPQHQGSSNLEKRLKDWGY
jgi:riboflavin synthase